jgi:hypothetical protein
VANYSPVQAGFGAPQRQSRWKVAFRLILAIPLILWLFLLSIAAGVLIVIGWFAALILGRLPQSFVGPLSGYIVFVTRVYSYLYLMNDARPPFSVKKNFGVNLEIPNSKVRRLAVLFRPILLFPVAIVSVAVSTGVQVASIFIWLIVLVKGEMPLPLFGALAAVLRYQARFYAYYMMITSKYPGELFGDQPTAPSDVTESPEGVLAPLSPTTEPPIHFATIESVAEVSTSASVTSSVDDDVEDSNLAVTPGAPTGAPMEFTTNESPLTPEDAPRTARLVLSQGSKRILVTFLILGAVGFTTQTVLQSRLRNNESALARLTTANNVLTSEVLSAKTQKTSCTLASNACLQQYFTGLANDFNAFDVTLNNTSFASGTQADAVQFEKATSGFIAVLEQLKSGSSPSPAQLSQLQTLGTAFDTDFQQVISDLSSPI